MQRVETKLYFFKNSSLYNLWFFNLLRYGNPLTINTHTAKLLLFYLAKLENWIVKLEWNTQTLHVVKTGRTPKSKYSLRLFNILGITITITHTYTDPHISSPRPFNMCRHIVRSIHLSYMDKCTRAAGRLWSVQSLHRLTYTMQVKTHTHTQRKRPIITSISNFSAARLKVFTSVWKQQQEHTADERWWEIEVVSIKHNLSKKNWTVHTTL